MKFFEVKVKLESIPFNAVFTVPAVVSPAHALDMVENAEGCPRRCLTVVGIKELCFDEMPSGKRVNRDI